MLAALLLGCSAENAVDDSGVEACSDGESLVYVMNTISWARRDDNDVVWGFDIDGLDSDDNDSDGCNHQDLVDPLGNTGIDNSISGLLPVMDLTAAVSVEGLIQDSINTGELLLMLELSGFGGEPIKLCTASSSAPRRRTRRASPTARPSRTLPKRRSCP